MLNPQKGLNEIQNILKGIEIVMEDVFLCRL